MVPPITLLKPGSLVARMGESQEVLDKKVPINYIMDWFDKRILHKSQSGSTLSMSDRVVVLLSKTGSGKSTAIAPNLYLRFFNRYRKRIVITQPRVLTTLEIPKDISRIEAYQQPNKEGLSLELYRNLGYQTQEFSRKPKEKGILFVTTGILLQYLKNIPDDDFLKKFKFIIIDEAHDRSLDVDLVLFMMRELIKRNLRKDPPFLILMSATMNVDLYANYFETKTIFEVSGQSKPISIVYPPNDVQNIYASIINIIKDIERKEESESDAEAKKIIEDGIRDIIIFMPSTFMILKAVAALEDANNSFKHYLLPLSITAADINRSSMNYQYLIMPIKNIKLANGKIPYRRVIVSTNVAETGLTLENLRYCIDSGLVFVSDYDSQYDSGLFMIKPTTSSMSLQRKGRVGRKFPGIFYPLFTEETFNHMDVDNVPSILTEDIGSHILAMMIYMPKTPIHKLPIHNFITAPPHDNINQASELLFLTGAIDTDGYLTKIGHIMGSFRKLSLQSCAVITYSIMYDISIKDIIIIVLMSELKKSDYVSTNPKIKPISISSIVASLYGDDKTCDIINYNKFKMKLLVSCEFIEPLVILQWFEHQFQSKKIAEVMSWCIEVGLNFDTLFQIINDADEISWQLSNNTEADIMETRSSMLDILIKAYADPMVYENELVELVCKYKQCIYHGYQRNVLRWNDKENNYYDRYGNKVMVKSKLVSPLSFQKIGAPFEQNRPKLLMYKKIYLKSNAGKYQREADTISVLDGFVQVDLLRALL